MSDHKGHMTLTSRILMAMLLGIGLGLALHLLPTPDVIMENVVEGLLAAGGEIFIVLMKMLVVPVVLVSLVCGVSNLGDSKTLGRIGIKTVALYLCTTVVALTLAITFAELLGVGVGANLTPDHNQFDPNSVPTLKESFVNMFSPNPFQSMARGDTLQVIIFALILGTAISLLKKRGEPIAKLFNQFNLVVMKMTTMVFHLTPYGVFCLVSVLFAQQGYALILDLFGYFATVLLVLIVHVILTNTVLLQFVARLNPLVFFKKMFSAMMFGFSTASSNVSIPVVLETVERKLGVKNSVASFIIPLGATINMDGTAIMQGVATVFISHAYGIDIGITGYLTVVLMATFASIGAAGIPSVGLITLTMVLNQVGLPVEGIALIIGVDRLLDMVRTAVNITGDSAVCCVVAQSEDRLNKGVYDNPDIEI